MYRIGQIVEGIVTGIQAYGAFVQIDAETSGLIHISELSDGYVKNINTIIKVKDKVRVKILDIDPNTHQLRLSFKALEINHRKARPKMKDVPQQNQKGFSSIKEALPNWIEEAKERMKHA